MVWPLTRVHPLGWALYEELTSGQQTQLDINAASGADGTLWTDVALVKQFTSHSSGWPCDVIVWHEPGKSWHRFEASPFHTFALRSFEGRPHWDVLPEVLEDGSGFTPRAAASSGQLIIVAGDPTLAAVTKYRTSSTNGDSWVARNSSDATSSGVRCICWHSGASMFVSGLDDGIIETSPISGAAWTTRHAAGAAVIAVASSGVAIIALVAASATVLRSVDGITWTAINPGLGGWTSVAFNPYTGKFLLTSSGNFASSDDDGATWTLGANPAIADAVRVAAFRRLWLVLRDVDDATSRLLYGTDGLNWSVAAEFGGTGKALAVSSGRVAVIDSDSNFYLSAAGGF